MSSYQNKSIEELRVEDYQANRKMPAAGTSGFGGGSVFGGGSGSLFGGASAAPTASAFGASSQPSTFGGAPAFGSNATQPAFGATSQPSAFGAAPAFGSATTQPAFGSTPANTGGGLFGNAVAKPSIFGQPAQVSAFGSTTSSQGAFGAVTSTAGSGLFGGGTSAFGSTAAKPSLFGGPTSTTPAFGSTTATPAFGGTSQPSAFGATSAFGSTTAQPAFGSTPANTGGGLFGNTAAKPSIFGQPSQASAFGSTKSTTGAFGAVTSTAGGGLFGGGTSAFGSTAAKPSLFGGPTSTTPAFGSTTATPAFGGTSQPSAFGATSAFGSTTAQPAFGSTAANTGGGLFGNAAAKPSIFGQPAQASAFGPTTSTQGAFGAGGGLFGGGTSAFGSTAAKPSLFGGPTSTTPAFGSMGASSAFGGAQQMGGAQPGQVTLSGDTSESAVRQAIIESQLSLYPYGDSQLLRPYNLSGREEDVKETAEKQKQDHERVYNHYTTSKLAAISTSAAKPAGGGEASQRAACATQRASAFNYRPLVQRIGFGSDSMNASSDSRHNESVQSPQSGLFEIPKTNLFVPSMSSLTKKRDNPKLLETSLVAETLNNSASNASHTINRSLPTPATAASPHSEQPPRAVNFDMTTHRDTNTANTTDTRRALDSASDGYLSVLHASNGSQSAADSAQLPRAIRHGPVGITLSKADYYTEPRLDELEAFVRDGEVHLVDGFAIGRRDYGRVEWHGPILFSNIDLGELIRFHRKEVVVYPDESKKPPIGQGFNRKAIVSLNRVFPYDRATREEIRDPLSDESKNFSRLLERKCNKMDCDFIEYDAENGIWTFRVRHFSRYGFFEDEDEETQPQPKRLKASKPLQPIQEAGAQQQQQSNAATTAQKARTAATDAPKKLFISETNGARMSIAADILEFIEPALANASRAPQARDFVIRKPVRAASKFELNDGIFLDAAFQTHLRVNTHPLAQRVGFGPSSNISVTTLMCNASNEVAISKIKLVPTIEAYLTNHLKSIGRQDDMTKLIRTETLRMKPPSAFLRLVDSYLFNDLRTKHSLDDVNERMQRFCVAVCQTLDDVKFSLLQRLAFTQWLRAELETELTEKLASLKREGTNQSQYAPVFYCLYYGFLEKASQIAATNGLVQLSMFIGFYLSNSRVPTRLASYAKSMLESMLSVKTTDAYRKRVYALLARQFEFNSAGRDFNLRENIPPIHALALELAFCSSPRSSLHEVVKQMIH